MLLAILLGSFYPGDDRCLALQADVLAVVATAS